MFPCKWLVPVLWAGAVLSAQSASDLNGLVTAANHYVSSGMAGAHDPQTLALSTLAGDSGSPLPDLLMTTATDVQHWTFRYKITNAGPLPPSDGAAAPGAEPHLAVLADCTRGVFNSFRYSSTPVTGVKSLEYTWVAVPLDLAIANLNANGYVRGFSGVELIRPDVSGFPDELVYVFNCPWERRKVAISCQTGAVSWSYGY